MKNSKPSTAKKNYKKIKMGSCIDCYPNNWMTARFPHDHEPGTCFKLLRGTKVKWEGNKIIFVEIKTEMIKKFKELGFEDRSEKNICPFYPNECHKCLWFDLNMGSLAIAMPKNYFLWFNNAVAFLKSSKLIYENVWQEFLNSQTREDIRKTISEHPILHSRHRTFLLMMGYAFENLLKSLLAVKLGEKETFHENWYTHDLVELCEFAGIKNNFDKEYKIRLLDILSSSIKWTAKYPGPKQENEIWSVFRDGSFIASFYPPNIVVKIEELFWEIYEQFPLERKKELKEVLDKENIPFLEIRSES